VTTQRGRNAEASRRRAGHVAGDRASTQVGRFRAEARQSAGRTAHRDDGAAEGGDGGIDRSAGPLESGFELEFEANWRDVHDVERDTAEYIDGFYNPRRRHSHNSYLSPIDFEHQFMQQEIASQFGVHRTGSSPPRKTCGSITSATPESSNATLISISRPSAGHRDMAVIAPE
jgi:hypothetical protein